MTNNGRISYFLQIISSETKPLGTFIQAMLSKLECLQKFQLPIIAYRIHFYHILLDSLVALPCFGKYILLYQFHLLCF